MKLKILEIHPLVRMMVRSMRNEPGQWSSDQDSFLRYGNRFELNVSELKVTEPRARRFNKISRVYLLVKGVRPLRRKQREEARREKAQKLEAVDAKLWATLMNAGNAPVDAEEPAQNQQGPQVQMGNTFMGTPLNPPAFVPGPVGAIDFGKLLDEYNQRTAMQYAEEQARLAQMLGMHNALGQHAGLGHPRPTSQLNASALLNKPYV